MSVRRAAGLSLAALLVTATTGLAGAQVSPTETTEAPGAPGKAATWAAGDKDGFGTSRTLRSKVWYTLNDGTLTEVFFPRIDTPATRDTQLLVTDGSTFVDREDEDTDQQVELIRARSPVYRQVNTAKSGKYRITKTYVTDPSRSAVLVDIRFEALSGGPYSVYVLHDVGLGLNANDDTGRSAGGGLVATDDELSSAVLASSGFAKTSSGYLDLSDGWTDLKDDRRMDLVLHRAEARQRRPAGRDTPHRPLRRPATAAGAGLRAQAGCGDRDRPRRPGPGLLRRAGGLLGRLAGVLLVAEPRARERGRLAGQLHRLGDAAGGSRGQDLPRRVRRRPGPPVGVGQRAPAPAGVHRRLVARPVRDRDRPDRGGRHARRPPVARLPMDGAAAS